MKYPKFITQETKKNLKRLNCKHEFKSTGKIVTLMNLPQRYEDFVCRCGIHDLRRI
jgi:hypothetical protein